MFLINLVFNAISSLSLFFISSNLISNSVIAFLKNIAAPNSLSLAQSRNL